VWLVAGTSGPDRKYQIKAGEENLPLFLCAPGRAGDTSAGPKVNFNL